MAASPQRKGIVELLDHGSSLTTPSFQRSYAWTKENVRDYWRDLLQALGESGTPAEYFLGLIVIDDASEIEDGQQRLATTLLLTAQLFEAAEKAKKAGQHDAELALNVVSAISPALRTGSDAH